MATVRYVLGWVAACAIGFSLVWGLDEVLDRHRRRVPSLPESDADVPILAFKGATVDLAGKFHPIIDRHPPYGVDDDAICAIHGHQPCPTLGCVCGFYALASGHTNLLLDPHVPLILEVELSGTVIVCERGFRAGHQRVLHAWLGLCGRCGTRAANLYRAAEGGDYRWHETICRTCLTTKMTFDAVVGVVGVVGGSVPSVSDDGDLIMRPLKVTIFEPDELAAHLGVPVSEGVPPAG